MFEIEATPRYRLARPPLAQALAQVRFPLRARLQSLEGIAPVQEQLEDLFPYMQQAQIQQFQLVIGPGAPASASGESAQHWVFTDDAGSTLELAPDTATLAIDHRYQGVEDLSNRFRAVLEALAGPAAVQRCTRLGVRFLNVAVVPPGRDDAAWRDWFRPELVGWIGSDIFSPGTTLVASIMQTQLSAPPVGDLSGPPVDVQGVVRHGYVPPGTLLPGIPPLPLERPGYLLDLDLFIDAPQRLDAADLSAQFVVLHQQIDRFFRWTLTPAGEEYFGLEELP
jgi:uncharacterized protein (TIGR04255 family)